LCFLWIIPKIWG